MENENEIVEETVNSVEKYNPRYESDYISSDDNCFAMISNNRTEKIAPQNKKITIGNNQITLLLELGRVFSIFTKNWITSIKTNAKMPYKCRKDTKHKEHFERTPKDTQNVNSAIAKSQLTLQKCVLCDCEKRTYTTDRARPAWSIGNIYRTTLGDQQNCQLHQHIQLDSTTKKRQVSMNDQ